MKKINKVTDLGKIRQAVFADEASVNRHSESGLDWTPIGDVATAIRVGQAAPVLAFNSTGAVLYVAFGDEGMAAPTGPANGIPVAAGEKFVINSGANEFIRSSAAGLFAYKADV